MGTVVRLNPSLLFQLLLKAFQPDVVCDVGSLDGTFSLRFRRLLPGARIIAFEANPDNAQAMLADPNLERGGVRVEHKAAHSSPGTMRFYVEESGHSEEKAWRRGISSARPREADSLGAREIVVEAVRLDDYLGALDPPPESVALWVDVEGCAYEVLQSIEGIRASVVMVHVEVEDLMVWQGQRVRHEVEELMEGFGFSVVATGPEAVQKDVVFVSERLLGRARWKVDAIVAAARLLSRAQAMSGGLFHRLAAVYLERSR